MAIDLSGVINTNIVTTFMEEELRKSLVFSPLVRVHMDDVAPGSSYKVPGVTSVTVRDYGTSGITTEAMSDVSVGIAIDKSKYFSFRSEDVDKAQTAIEYVAPFTDRAVYELSNAVDVTIANALVSSAAAQIATTSAIDASTVLAWFGKAKVAMDRANIAQTGRWIVVSPGVIGALVEKLGAGALQQSGEQALQLGYQTTIFGMNIFMSNNLKTAGSGIVTAVGGVMNASDLIYSVQKFESVRDPQYFADINRGLLVFGYGVNNFSSIVNGVIPV